MCKRVECGSSSRVLTFPQPSRGVSICRCFTAVSLGSHWAEVWAVSVKRPGSMLNELWNFAVFVPQELLLAPVGSVTCDCSGSHPPQSTLVRFVHLEVVHVPAEVLVWALTQQQAALWGRRLETCAVLDCAQSFVSMVMCKLKSCPPP